MAAFPNFCYSGPISLSAEVQKKSVSPLAWLLLLLPVVASDFACMTEFETEMEMKSGGGGERARGFRRDSRLFSQGSLLVLSTRHVSFISGNMMLALWTFFSRDYLLPEYLLRFSAEVEVVEDWRNGQE